MTPSAAPAPVGPADEETLYGGRTHLKILFVPFLVQVAIVALHVATVRYFPAPLGHETLTRWAEPVVHGMLVVAAVVFAVAPFLKWYHSWFEVTDQRVEMRWGVLYKHSREIALDRITQINEERGIVDRIFRAGTIVIHDAANASAVRFHDVPRFRSVRATIDDARRQAQHRQQARATTPFDFHPGDAT